MAPGNSESEKMNRKFALLDQMEKVPSFSGTNPYYSLNSFKKEVNEWEKFFGWNEEEKFFILRKKLEGRAFEIFTRQDENIKTSDELFTLLEDRLEPKSSPNEKLQDLWNFKQMPDMAVEDFISIAKRKARLAAEAHSCTKDKVEEATEEWLLQALKNNILPQYKPQILRNNPKTTEKFKELAKLEEIAWKETNSVVNSNQNVSCNAIITQNNNEELIQMMKQMSEQMQKLNIKINELEKNQNSSNIAPQNRTSNSQFRNNPPQNRNVIICRQCGLRGHGFMECRFNFQNYLNNRGRGAFRGRNPRGSADYARENPRTAENDQQHDQENDDRSRNNNNPRANGRGHRFRGNPRNRDSLNS